MKYCLLSTCPTLIADVAKQCIFNKTYSNLLTFTNFVQVVFVQNLLSAINIKMYPEFLLLVIYFSSALTSDQIKSKALNDTLKVSTTETPFGCVCGIFLSRQFKRGSKEPPIGNPALIHDQPGTFSCTPSGNRLCTNKCLETIVKYLPNSPTILCSSIDYECYKERAYLFIKNCKNEWINTNLSAGREYCCKDGAPYKCPVH